MPMCHVHRSRLATICIDVPADVRDAEVIFWSGAIGRTARTGVQYPEYSVLGCDGHLSVLVQALGEGDARIHLDVHTDDVNSEVRRLESLGAKVVTQHDDWVVLRDPAGMLLCVVPVDVDDDVLVDAPQWD